jgi:nitroimidazol reductase NimA-like FMN-containing flavoprotein (pyridoxamine 5'-phosphate oxidase superfamily)
MPDDENRRRLTEQECTALLTRPLVGVFSSLAPDGWIHSVPVFYLFADGEIRVYAGVRSVKTRNVERSGTATVCVEVTDGSVRSYVSVSGPAVVRAPEKGELQQLDARYSRSDFAADHQANVAAGGEESSVMLVLRPDRWIAWADWD